MLEINNSVEKNSEINQVLKDVGSTLCNDLQSMFQKDPSSVLNVLDDMRGNQAMPAGFASADQLLGSKNADYNYGSSLLSPAPDYNFGRAYAGDSQPDIIINIFEGSPIGNSNITSPVKGSANDISPANTSLNQMQDSAANAHAAKSQPGAFGAMDYLKSAGKLLNQFEQNFSNPNGDPLAGVGNILKGAFGKTGTGAEIGGILGSVVNSLDQNFSPNYHQSISQAASGNKNAGGAGTNNLFDSFAGQGGVIDNLSGTLSDQFSSFSDTASSIANQTGDIVSGAGDLAGDIAGTSGDLVGDAGSAAADLAGTAADGIGELAGDVAPALFSLL